MSKKVFVIFLLFWSSTSFSEQRGRLPSNLKVNSGNCKMEMDTLTKQFVYTTVDIEPTNQGGKGSLLKAFEAKITMRDISIDTADFDPNVIVAFVVDTDGSIKGPRIINDQTNKVGQQMLDIIISFKWTPAKCNGKFVPMIQK